MSLVQRLLLGALLIVSVLVLGVLVIAGGRLQTRLTDEMVEDLHREARLVASMWRPDVDPDALADSTGRTLGRRVTLVDHSGLVLGDSEFSRVAVRRLENHADRAEIVQARLEGMGSSSRTSASSADRELYVAVRAPLGFTRVSLPLTRVYATVSGAQRDVMLGGAFGLMAALMLAALFARGVSRPVVELRDVARSIAAGDLHARPALSAPGEVGDLAEALHRMAEQLAARLTAMRQDDAFMSALVEALAEGVFALDPRGQVVRINRRARELLAVDDPVPFPAERLPRSAVLRRAMEESLRGAEVAAQELEITGQTLAMTARPLGDGGAVVTLLDLTAIRRLELVRRDFVANVSHELRTPLTVITGFAETLLTDESLPAEQRRRFLESVHANGVRMQRIVDDLLDLSRIESGRWTPHVTEVDLGAVVHDIFSSVGEQAGARGVHLESQLSVPRVQADATALRQVLANLVENALRYTESGTVRVAAERGAEGVWVKVRDTGTGIAPEHLPRIFERFYRADPGRSRSAGGTGLGLAIVKHLVDAHGGRVQAESMPGVGTVVSVLFPG